MGSRQLSEIERMVGVGLAFVLLALLAIPQTGWCADEQPEDLVVVANFMVPIDSITIEDLRAIFSKMRKTWTGGLAIEPIHAPDESKERLIFSWVVFGKSPQDAVRDGEDRRIMRGDTPPVSVSNQKNRRLRKVFAHKGSISYVLRKDYLAGVSKVLAVIPVAQYRQVVPQPQK